MKDAVLLLLLQENYALKLKCFELQNELQELKAKQEKLYRNHANSILLVQNNYVKLKNRSLSI
jgi:hypothetical protein